MRHSWLVLLLIGTLTIGSLGCGSGDDPIPPLGGGTVSTSYAAVTTSFRVPGPAVTLTSLRAATYWKEFVLKIGNLTLTPTDYSVDSSTNPSTIVLIFNRTFTKAELGANWDETSKKIINAQLVEGGQPIANISSIPANDQSSSSSGIPVATTVVFALSTDTVTGGLKVTTVSGGGAATSLVPTASDALFIEGITYRRSNGTTATFTNDVADVPTQLPSFSILFNTVITSPSASWIIEVKSLTSGAAFTLTSSADASLFTVGHRVVDNKSVVDITVLGNSSKKLVSGRQYQITLKSTSIARADKTTVTFANAAVVRTFRAL